MKRIKKRPIVIYSSQTGFTKRYAKWIAEDLGCQYVSVKDVKWKKLDDYDILIYGGWLQMNNVKDFYKLQKYKRFSEKPLVMFGVGVTSMEATEALEQIEEMNIGFLDDMDISFFYFEGGLNYSRMNFVNKQMLNSLRSNLQKNAKKLSEGELAMVKKLEKSYDGGKREYIEPLVEKVKSMM